ncbi:MAG: DUF1553 domain-containing protein [Acidobacteriota bacterium]
MIGTLLAVVPAAVIWQSASSAAEPGGPVSAEGAAQKLFVNHIQPLLEEHCQMCHSDQVRQGGLDLSSAEGLKRGGVSGPALVAGNAEASLLYQLVAHKKEPAMPFKAGKLSSETIALIELWINLGAPFVSAEPAPVAVAAASTASAKTMASGSPALKLFSEQVRPVLQTQCLMCHGGKFKQAGLNLSTSENLLRGSDNGPVIVPGKADESLLIKKLRHEHEPGMPYKAAKLADPIIARFVEWVNAGAPYDQPLQMDPSVMQTELSRPGSDHWAFQTPKRPVVPRVKNQSWVRNAIDAFVAARHEEMGLTPAPPAEKAVLLRRVYLDLIGIPPTPEQTHAFVADRSSDAYEKVVDLLLSSPQYGERWGRHWMDVWRYSDWYGFGSQVRNSQPHIWQWRDWIIEALNQDKGYDQMIVEMFAGDEVAPTDVKTLRATGYLARSWYRFNRNAWLQETVEHAAAGFLGITMKCARCHDHKYDPIAQEEYYRFRAFFEPYDVRLDPAPGEADLTKNGIPRAYDAEPREATTKDPFLPAIYAETYRFIRGDEKSPDKEHPLRPGVPEALGGANLKIEPISLPAEAAYPPLRDYVQQDLVRQAQEAITQAEEGLAKSNEALKAAQHRMAMSSTSRLPSLISAAAPGPAAGEDSAAGHAEIDFAKQITPIFEKNCVTCHRSGNARNGLALDSLASILDGGQAGPAVLPRNSEESPLVLFIEGKRTPRMPYGSAPLPESEIALIRRWIDQLPEEEPAVALRKAEAAVALAEKKLRSAQAYLPALEARIAADRAKYGSTPDPQTESLAKAAGEAEGRYQLLKAQENLLQAQQKLNEVLLLPKPDSQEAEKDRNKKLATAKKDLEAAQTALSKPQEEYTPIGEMYPKSSSGRRLALARWMVSSENPLTSRVAINQIWMRHFGNPLVPTVANFGLNGRPPSHPELLDWLACEFMDQGWSMKAIHRLMVTSSTYRMRSSAAHPDHRGPRSDPENHYFWKMNPQRMEAEVVRDSLLSLSGRLDLTMGGPELDQERAEHLYRRSLYFHHTPDSQAVFLKLFNAPDPTDCYKREESIVPQQALALANSKLSRSLSRLLAREISEKLGSGNSDADFIKTAFETTLGRVPTASELKESRQFLVEQAALFRSPDQLTVLKTGTAGSVPPAGDASGRARENLVHVLFNHNDFVTIR